MDYELLLQQPEINEIISSDITGLINEKEGFRTFERIYKFKLLFKPFEPGIDLSTKMEPLRHKIANRYDKEIHVMFRK